MLPYDNSRNDGNGHDFAKPFVAAIVAGYIGSRLDRTAFGRWFNTNPVINKIFFLIRLGFILMVIAGIMLYLWILFNE